MGANAQTSVPAFTSGQVLTAAQMTQVNTGIPVFASSTERDAAFGGAGEKTLAEGQMAYLEDTNATQYYDGSSWSAVAGGKILQVVSTTKTDTFSATSATFTDVTGLSATITPTSASSTIHVLVTATGNGTVGSTVMHLRVTRGGTAILVGDAAGSRTQASVGGIYEDAGNQGSMPYTVSGIDSPATTSSTTYAVQVRNQGAGTVHINRGSNDTNNAGYPRTVSTITLMEVSA